MASTKAPSCGSGPCKPLPAGSSSISGSPAWIVTVLMLFYVLSFLDRQVLSLMVGPIKAALHLSDLEISLLQGLAFACFYAVIGIPLGWAIDRYSRRWLIFAGVTVWAASTAFCGTASRFSDLLLARCGVGAGEAVLVPAAYSILSDVVPEQRLSLYLSVFAIGAPIGSAVAIFLAGTLVDLIPANGVTLGLFGHFAGWQLIFMLVGLPGLALALFVFTFREPPRRRSSQFERGDLGAVFAYMRRHKQFYIGHFTGFSLLSLAGYGILLWTPTYLIRHFNMTGAEVGMTLAATNILPGIVGGLGAGWLVDRWFSSGRRDAHLRFFAAIAVVQPVLVVAAFAMPSRSGFMLFMGLEQSLASFVGVAAAALQLMTPSRFRGRVSAIYLFVFNLVGYGCGATIVAIFTDFLFHNNAMVGWSIALCCTIFMPLGGLCLAIAMRPMRIALERGILDTTQAAST